MFSEAFVQWRAGNTNALVKKIMRLAKVKGKPGKLVGKALVEKLKTPVKVVKKKAVTFSPKEQVTLKSWFNSAMTANDIRYGELARKNFDDVLKNFYPDFGSTKVRIPMLKSAIEDAKVFNKVLNKLPKHKGIVFRGGSYSDYKLLGELKPGMTWKQGASVSTSTSESVASDFLKHAAKNLKLDDLYMLEVKAKTGVNISKYAPEQFKNQLEVVMRGNTKYKVVSVTNFKKYGKTIKQIVLEEV